MEKKQFQSREEFQLTILNKITRKDNAQEMKGYETKQRFKISMMQQIKY